MFQEARYGDAQRRRNRKYVALITIAGVGACIAAGALTSWPWPNALGSAGLVIVFGAALWWAFASRKAGPLGIDEGAMARLKRTFWMG